MKSVSLAVFLSLLAPPVFAASGVSSNFDGVYLGAVRASSGGCPVFDIGRVTISHGALKSESAEPAISGIITEEGYVQATMSRNGATGPLDGRLENGISARAIWTAPAPGWWNCAQRLSPRSHRRPGPH